MNTMHQFIQITEPLISRLQEVYLGVSICILDLEGSVLSGKKEEALEELWYFLDTGDDIFLIRIHC